MRRVLAILLSLVFLISAAAAAGAECAPGAMSLGNAQEHGCCGEQALSAAPVGPCCVVAQPVRERTLVEGRTINPKDRRVVATVADHSAWLQTADLLRQQRRTSHSVSHARPVPLYLTHLSLLL